MANRTDDEIVERIKELREEDPFGFETSDLVGYLPWDRAKEFLKPEAEKEHTPAERDRASVLKQMADYLPFAVGKATNHRGLSAGRSISHYSAWVWMLGDEDYKAIDWNRYARYGAPILKQISERFGIPLPQPDTTLAHEVDMAKGFARMAQGEPCVQDCNEGCH